MQCNPNGEKVERIEHNRYILLVKTSITVIGLARLLNREDKTERYLVVIWKQNYCFELIISG
jgi:hypothetical protein